MITASVVVWVVWNVSLQQDYQTYVSRKAKKREDLVTSLTEYHQQELQKIQAEREALIKKFEEKKTSRCQSEYSLWLNISLLFRFEHGFAEGARVISSGG